MDNYNVQLSNEAELDIHVATIWYESRSTALASKFLDKTEIAFQRIAANPFAFSRLTPRSKYRKYRTAGFPYKIYYYTNVFTVEIMAVIHTRRSNRYINRRLK